MLFNMKFKKHYLTSAFLIVTSIGITSCGMLGQKNKPAESSAVGGTGCLDNSKDLVGRYVSGEMDQSEWKSSFDCINQSLNFFTQYVRGSNENSYSQGDMYTLISRFLITTRPVHRELMRGVFNLKQSLFGGDASQLTNEQIELLKNSLTRLQVITGDLIPYLKLRQDPNATYEEMIEMVNAFRRAGEQLADYMGTLPVTDLSDQALTVLIDQLTDTLELPVIEGLDRKMFLAKWMMFNTRRDAIEGRDWPQFFRAAMTFGGIAVAFKSSQTINNPDNKPAFNRIANDYRYREFIWELFQQVKPNIVESLTKHDGNTPFPMFDHVIDELPDTFLNGIPKQTLKQTMRPFVRKLLLSQTQTGVDQGVIDTIYKLGGDLVQDLGLLDRFYEKANLDHYDVPADVMKMKLGQFEESLTGPQKDRFTAIKNNILAYPPLFFKDSVSILYSSGVGYTRMQNLYVIAADRVLKHLLRTYGSGDGYFIESDFQLIFKEYTDILFAIKFVDPTVSNFGSKRFQDIDLFTPVSDGNRQVSIPEIIHYGMEVISAATLTNKMREEITPKCNQNLGVDIMGWTWVPVNCFRNEFNKNLDYWITYFPRLKNFWATLTPEQKEQSMMWIEHGSRRDGYSGNDIGKFDFGAMAAVLHYTETLFTRFDQNNDEFLGKSEVLKAYPVFKILLAKKAKMDASKDYLLKGIFSYIVKYREMPVTNSVNALAKLGWWLAIYTLPTTKYSADRAGVFNIVCQLANPESTAQQDMTPTICKP
jgi:hypothetical protein